MLRKPLALLFAAAFTVSLAACGGDDGDSSAPDEGSDSTEAPAASSEAPDSSEGGDDSAATTAAPDFSGEGGSEFCTQAQHYEQELADQSIDPTDPESVRDSYAATLEALETMRENAPDEIRADVVILTDTFAAFVDLVGEDGFDMTKLQENPEAMAALESLNTQEFLDASTRIAAYASEVCGIEAAED